MQKWITRKPRTPRKRVIRKFKKEKTDSGAYSWDLGIVAFGFKDKKQNG